MTLLASFTHPVADSQRALRLIHKALSEPGMALSLPHFSAWGSASPAATAVLMTLVDRDTPRYVDGTLDNDAILESLIPDADEPKKRTTIVMDVASLNGGLTLRLSGPDVTESRAVAPKLPESVLRFLREGSRRNIDLIFTCRDRMIALPGTTDIRVC